MGVKDRPWTGSVWAWMLLGLCAAVFIWRGPLRAADPTVNMDTPLLLAAATTWRQGGNPYEPSSISATLGSRAVALAPTLRRGQQAFVYPPAFYALLGPITHLPWETQRWVWNVLNASMFVAAVLLICMLAAMPLLSLRSLVVLAIGLVSNPTHICLALGQTGVVLLFLLGLYWWSGTSGWRGNARSPSMAAIALSVALVIKPQIAAAYLGYDLFTARRNTAAAAGLLAAALLLAALAVHGDAWAMARSWFDNMHALLQADADPLHGSLPHQLINLQSPLAVLTGSRALASALAIAGCGVLGALYAWIDRRESLQGVIDPLNALSAVTILMLLVFYHRVYDAVFLMVPAVYAVNLAAAGSRAGWALLLSLVPLWVPLSSLLYHLAAPTSGFTVSAFAQAFIIQHQTWFLLGAFVILLTERGRGYLYPGFGVSEQVRALN